MKIYHLMKMKMKKGNDETLNLIWLIDISGLTKGLRKLVFGISDQV